MRIFLRLFGNSIGMVLTFKFGYDITIMELVISDKVDYIEINQHFYKYTLDERRLCMSFPFHTVIGIRYCSKVVGLSQLMPTMLDPNN